MIGAVWFEVYSRLNAFVKTANGPVVQFIFYDTERMHEL